MNVVTALTPAEVEQRLPQAVVLDVREPREFGRGHVPGAVSIALPNVVKWGPRVLDKDAPLILVAEPDEADSDDEHTTEAVPEEVAAALASLTQVGLAEQVVGYLAGGYEAWAAAGLPSSTLTHLGARVITDQLGPQGRLVDVRTPEEFAEGHIPGATNHPLEDYPAMRAALQGNDRPLLLICRIGNRSATAASLLLRDGVVLANKLHNLIGGYNAWRTINAD